MLNRKWSKSLIVAGTLLVASALAVQPASAATYTVKKGDTLYQIAQKYGIDLNKLLGTNGQLADCNVIWEGLKIYIPNVGTKNPGTTAPAKPDNGATTPAKPAKPSNPGTTTPAKPDNGATGGNTSGGGAADKAQSEYAAEVVRLVNVERSKAGLPALASNNAKLNQVALDKAKDMYHNNYFSHTSPTYGSPFDMMRSYGIKFTYAGENIAKGQRTPQEVMNAWMNSPGHRANILNSNFTTIGVAYYNGVWVQEFIK